MRVTDWRDSAQRMASDWVALTRWSYICEHGGVTESEPTLFDEHDSEVGVLGGIPTTVVGDLHTPGGLLALMDLPRIGSGRAIKIAQAFGSAEALNQASPEERRRACGVAFDEHVRVYDVEPPHESVRLLSVFDPEYPALLADIKDRPALLWVRGALPDPAPRVAIVGTRNATPWGSAMAASIAEAAAEAGVSVVSGLALGIDIAAHRATIAGGGHTIAVLGSGIDRPSPKEHLAEAEEIVESGGCLLTEQPVGAAPSPRNLVARNRLQSGLSAATVVVQCATKSGTMATAAAALAQGRVLAIPRPMDPNESVLEQNLGTARLLEDPRVLALQARTDLDCLLRGLR